MSQSLPPDEKQVTPEKPETQPAEQPGFKFPAIPVWAKILLMVAVVFVASIGYFRGQMTGDLAEIQEPPPDAQTAEKRMPAPDAQFITKAGGPISLSSLRGKVVLLSFWAHWCAPCLVELPSFKVLHQRLGSEDFAVMPINLDEGDQGKDFIKNFWETKALPFDTYFDPEKKAAKAFKVETLPSNFVLDREGRIVMVSFGSNDWSNDSTVELIESLLNEK